MPSLPHLLASSILRIWLANSTHSWRRLPRPRDEPVVRVPGEGTDRILVVGSGAVVGYGVLSYELSVSGQVARQVAAETGRGIELRIIASPDLDVRAAATALAGADLRGYDVVILSLGALDVLELLPASDWAAHMELLLDTIDTGATESAKVLLMGVPQLTQLVTIPRIARGMVARRCDALNAESALLASRRAGAVFVPFTPPALDLMQNARREVHTVWARIITPTVIAALEKRRGTER